jgi:DNA-binding NarL/FixJ family response regulator
MRAVRVLFADDHELLLSLLQEYLRGEWAAPAAAHLASKAPPIEVVFTTTNPDDALSGAIAHRPDVVVMDVDMPGRNVFDVARAMQASVPSLRVLFFSSHMHDRYIEQAINAGGRGYLLKTCTKQELFDAIRAIAAGETAFSPSVLERVVIEPKQVGAPKGQLSVSFKGDSEGCTRISTLSPRELEVLRYLAQGMSKKEIASVMVLSVKTVQNHADRLMQKLDIHDRVQLARFAIREGLLTP